MAYHMKHLPHLRRKSRRRSAREAVRVGPGLLQPVTWTTWTGPMDEMDDGPSMANLLESPEGHRGFIPMTDPYGIEMVTCIIN